MSASPAPPTPPAPPPVPHGGASPQAIASHYDLGNDFFRLWLDEAMIYTCALWGPGPGGMPAGADSLEEAQARKVDFLLEAAGAPGASRILDIGCGWGGLMRRAVARHGVGTAIGLTLAREQAEWVEQAGQAPDGGSGRPEARVEVRLESWADHVPTAPYDAILCVEAFEAFARLGLPPEEKRAIYRAFFDRCHAWLRPGGGLALQVIAYGNAGPEDFDGFIAEEIFPESDLPRLAELAEAFERRFEVVALWNRRRDYAPTLRAWLGRLKGRRAEAVALVGEDVVVRFERYLRLSIHMFERGACDLLQLQLRRIDHPRLPPAPGGDPADRPREEPPAPPGDRP